MNKKDLELSDWVKGELRELFAIIDEHEGGYESGRKTDMFDLLKATCMVKEFASSMKCTKEELRKAVK